LLALLVAPIAAVGIGAPGASAQDDGGLALIAAWLRAAPPPGVALAAEASEDGQWRFLSPNGEIFTAGTPEELARVARVLFPDAPRDADLALYLAANTVFLHRQALAALPKGSKLNLFAGAASYPLIERKEGEVARLFARLRPHLMLALEERAGFEEAVWQLTRPLAAAVRILALEPDGPPTLASSPRPEPESGRALVDAVDPRSLAAALTGIRGQTVLITGSIADGRLSVQPARGDKTTLALADLFAAAAGSDVNLIVLDAASAPRQPGGRNWLWQKVEVEGLGAALANATLADFCEAIGAANRSLLVTAKVAADRASLTMLPAAGPPSGIDVHSMVTSVLAQITGKVSIAGVAASLRSAAREQELARRVVPGIPSMLQLAYLALLLLGVAGLSPARAAWRRLWPPEMVSEYAGRAGHLAARMVRGLAFLLLFLPFAGLVGLPYLLLRGPRSAGRGMLRVRRARRLPAAP
jgi:hypothetical protein